jgi:hypothetical protein
MHRAALALTVLLSGCVVAPSSRETCDFVAESSALEMTPLRIKSSERSKWLKEVGLSTAGYRSTHWYQSADDTRLVCLYTNKCTAEAMVYRKNSSGWHKIEPPDSAILCVLVTPNKSLERTRGR